MGDSEIEVHHKKEMIKGQIQIVDQAMIRLRGLCQSMIPDPGQNNWVEIQTTIRASAEELHQIRRVLLASPLGTADGFKGLGLQNQELAESATTFCMAHSTLEHFIQQGHRDAKKFGMHLQALNRICSSWEKYKLSLETYIHS